MFDDGVDNLNFLIINSEVLRLSFSRVILLDAICLDLWFHIFIVRSNFPKVRCPVLLKIKIKLTFCIGHILLRNCLPKLVI
jgi:hypothetical protein